MMMKLFTKYMTSFSSSYTTPICQQVQLFTKLKATRQEQLSFLDCLMLKLFSALTYNLQQLETFAPPPASLFS